MVDARDIPLFETGQLHVEVDRPGAVDHGAKVLRDSVVVLRRQTELGVCEVGGEGNDLAARLEGKRVVDFALDHGFLDALEC